MDYAELSPEQTQVLTAQALRSKQMLGDANTSANRFGNFAAIAQLANNPDAARAAIAAHKNAQAQHAPTQMGNQGFALPSGDFAQSPMYAEEKMMARNQQAGLRDVALAQAKAAQEAHLTQQAELQRERLGATASQKNQDRMLRGAITAIAQSNRGAVTEEKRQAAQTKAQDSSIQKYSAALEKAAVPDLAAALDIAEKKLTQYKPGELPGFGRVLSAVPVGMLPEEGQQARTDMQMAANMILKSRSGAAVTDSEMRRFLTEVATGAGMSETSLRKGWQNVRRAFDAKRQNLSTMISPEAHDEYAARGGTDFRPTAQPAAPPGLQLPPGFKIIGPAP